VALLSAYSAEGRVARGSKIAFQNQAIDGAHFLLRLVEEDGPRIMGAVGSHTQSDGWSSTYFQADIEVFFSDLALDTQTNYLCSRQGTAAMAIRKSPVILRLGAI
jgi:hypothetical protein